MFGMNLKDFAGWACVVIGAITAMFLGLAPVTVDQHIMTWPCVIWATFALTVMVCICSLIERRESSKSDKKRDGELLERDATIQKLSGQFESFQKQQQKFSEVQEKSIEEAKKLYAAIKEMAEKSPSLAAQIGKDALEKGLTGLVTLPGGGSGISFPLDFLKDLLKSAWKWRSTTEKRKRIDEMRKAADSLVLSAFGLPVAELPLSNPKKLPQAGLGTSNSDAKEETKRPHNP